MHSITNNILLQSSKSVVIRGAMPSCRDVVTYSGRIQNGAVDTIIQQPDQQVEQRFQRKYEVQEVVVLAARKQAEVVLPKSNMQQISEVYNAIVTPLLALVTAAAIAHLYYARKRRIEINKLNKQLRDINQELRGIRDSFVIKAKSGEEEQSNLSSARVNVGDGFAMSALVSIDDDVANIQQSIADAKNSLEASVQAPSAEHPVEDYNGLSLSEVQQQVGQLLNDARENVQSGEAEKALKCCVQAADLSKDLRNVRTTRCIHRIQGYAHRKLGNKRAALAELQALYQLSSCPPRRDNQFRSDILGEIADLYTELGDLEKAAQYYDSCLDVMSQDELSDDE